MPNPNVVGDVPLLLERLFERFLDSTCPVAKDRCMPLVRKEIATLDRQGKLDVSEGLRLCGGIVWDAIRRYQGSK